MFIPLPFYSPMDAVPGLEINTLLDYLFKFFLSSIRLSAFLISSPFLGSKNIPLNVKIVFSMVISFFYFGYISDTEISINELENLFVIVVIEAIIGIALGLSLSIWFSLFLRFDFNYVLRYFSAFFTYLNVEVGIISM